MKIKATTTPIITSKENNLPAFKEEIISDPSIQSITTLKLNMKEKPMSKKRIITEENVRNFISKIKISFAFRK